MSADLLNETGLSLDRLQSFRLVARAGGVTKAAKGDPARQSLFSRQVKELEEFFGTELIRRKGRGVILTEAGHRLQVLTSELFASLTDFKNDCRGKPVEIVIGTGESIIQWLIMPRLEDLRHRLPNTRFKLLNLSTAEAVKRLADGVIDFAIVRKDAVKRPLQSTTLGALRYALFVPGGLGAGAAQTRKPHVVGGIPLATLEGEGRFRTELANLAKRSGQALNIQVECSSFPLVARAVAKGKVAGILPSIAAIDLVEAGSQVINLPFLKHFEREICLASNPRLIRIRPILHEVANAMKATCHL